MNVPGLVAWWPADGYAKDVVGGNNGLLQNGVSFAAGEVGQAFSFNAFHQQSVAIPYSSNLFVANLSVEAWINPASQVTNPDRQALIFGPSFGYVQLFVVQGTTGVRVLFQIGTSPGAFYGAYSIGEIPIGQFSHVVGTWDGTNLSLYVNGALNGQSTPPAQLVASGCPFYIGGFYHIGLDSCQAAGQYFDGLIDEVSLFNRPLALSEVQTLFQAGSAGKCPTPPVITLQPTNRTVTVGSATTFAVRANGFEPLSFQWLFNGTNIEGATSNSYSLVNIQPAQAGNYSVVLSNIGGTVLSSNALLTVNPACVPAPSGLAAWWPAEDNATDVAAGHNGALINGVGFSPAKVGRGFSFNGINQSVAIAYDPSLFTPAFSVEAWVNPGTQITNADGQAVIFGQSYGFVQLVVKPGTTGVRVVFLFGTSSSTFYEVGSTSEIPIGQFSHLAGTWDGTNLSLYINGALNARSTPGTSPVSSGCPFYIGGFYSPAADSCQTISQFFKGLIDDVQLYNRALSAGEIAAIYNADVTGLCPLPPVILLQPTNQVVTIGGTATFSVQAAGTPPVGYLWRLNGGILFGASGPTLTIFNVQSNNLGLYSALAYNSVAVAASSSATLSLLPPPNCAVAPAGLVSWWRGENDATDSWGTNTAPAGQKFNPGKVGQAFSISSSSYLVVSNSFSLNLTNSLTVEAWVYPSNLAVVTPSTIISKFDYAPVNPLDSQSSFYLGTTNNGALYFTVSATGSLSNTTTIQTQQQLLTNQWSLAVATYDGTVLRLYLNGQLAAQANYSAGIFAGTNNLGIGAIPTGPRTAYLPWNGLLDEITIYNRALSADEIEAIYNSGSAGKCLVPPVITLQPQSQAIPLLEDVVFSVSAVGVKPLSYQWRLNGQPLPGATSATLYLDHAQTNSAGDYSVVVSNSVGLVLSSNAALTLLPALQCVSTPPGLISWWPADRNSADAMGTNNLSFSFEFAQYVTGKVGQAFSLFGVALPIRGASTPSLNFGSNADFSMECWIKALPSRSDAAANNPILDKRSTVGTSSFGAGYSLSLYQGRLAFWLGTNSFNFLVQNYSMFISSGPDLRDSMFHHVAVSLKRDATNGGNLFVDGQIVLTFNPTLRNGSLSNSAELLIGAPVTPNGNSTFNGLIDELAVYNRALAPNQILAIRQAGAAGKCKVPPSIITQPASQRVTIGSNVTFSVGAAGSPRLNYQWLLSGASVPGATGSTYGFVAGGAGGAYSVRVTNVFGLVTSSNALLTVNHLPVAVCQNLIVSAGLNCTATASINNGSFDPDQDLITIAQSPPGPYPLGTNLVTLTVTDPLGAFSSCSATVTVVDTTAPLVLCPTNILTTNDLNQCGAVVTFPAAVATDTCSGVASLSSSPASGSFFPVGTMPVVWTATDGAGNVSSCTFTVTVQDVQAPVITCPADIVVTNAHNAFTTVVTFSPTVTDNCPGAGLPACTPASGTAFGVGTNVVSCTAMDAAGNVSRCSFKITVLPGNKPPVPVLAVSPVATFPGWTNLFVISANNSNAAVVFDGSKSYDPDDPTFLYFWYEGTNVFSTNAVATSSLALGEHKITLWLDDTFPLGTNSASVTVDIISASDAVDIVSGLVGVSSLPAKRQQPLTASLDAATASFERGNLTSGANQLGAFENKVNAQVAPSDPALAKELVAAVEQIISAVHRAP